MAPESVLTEDQLRSAWYAPVIIPAEPTHYDDQYSVISKAEAGGPSRPEVVTCSEKEILKKLETPAHNCTETLISIHMLLINDVKDAFVLPRIDTSLSRTGNAKKISTSI